MALLRQMRNLLKKTPQASEQLRLTVHTQRQAWFDGQLDLYPERLIFINETGANTELARLCGRAVQGERCRTSVPNKHWKTTTFIAGLRLNGVMAPIVLDDAMHALAFKAYNEQALMPEFPN